MAANLDADIDALLGDTFEAVGESPKELALSAQLDEMLDKQRGAKPKLVDPRTLPVRFTRLKTFALSAAHYLDAAQHELPDTVAIRMGAGFHGATFENRQVVCYEGRRQGKAWERFEAKWTERGAVILNEKEFATATGMIDSLRSHKRAMEILFDGTTTEQTLTWSFINRACRSTPDSERRGKHVTDLKSTRCAEPRWFAREALRRYYHAQLSFYDQAVGGADENYIVAVENVRPFNVVVFRIPDALREIGHQLNRGWFEQLLQCEASNTYPGYAESDVTLEVPEWTNSGALELEIDGELVSVD